MAITIPNTFVANTKIEAAPVNANFAEVANAVDKRGDTLTGNLSANAGVTVDGVDVSTIPNTSGTFNPFFPHVVIGTADTNGIRLDLESGTLAVREGDDSAYGPLISGLLTTSGNHVPATNDGGALGTTSLSWADLFLASGGVINFNNGDVTITHSTNTLTWAGASSGYIFNDGNVGIGGAPGSVRLDLIGLVDAIRVGNSTTNATAKEGKWLNRHYTNAEEDLMVVYSYSTSTDNGLAIGGGSGSQNAATLIGFYTAANNTTVIGTERLRINSSGHIAIGATARIYLDGVAGTGDTYIHESSANRMAFVAGGTEMFVSNSAVALNLSKENLGVEATKKFYLDGGGDTYIHENTSNQIQLVGGGSTMSTTTTNAVISAGAIGVGFASTNGGTSTGTAIVRNADTYFYLTSSSRRFKENISTAVVTDAQLDAFMATAPSWWDYKGQKNGALGFIAEDLAALPLDRYGFNPLVNYDGDGQIESNRDYALIAMHHLVIQRLERKIAALEARIH